MNYGLMASKPGISYLRVSAPAQGRSGLGLEAQREAVARFCEAEGYTLVGELVEVETAKGADTLNHRPKLREALDAARRLSCPVIVATLDRLSCNTVFVATLMSMGVPFIVTELSTGVDPFMLHPHANIPGRERMVTPARTKANPAANARGRVLGGPVPDPTTGLQASQGQAVVFASEVGPIASILRAEGASMGEIAAALGKQGIYTRRGAGWTAASVGALLQATDALRQAE